MNGMLRRMGMRGTQSAMATELDYLRALKVFLLPHGPFVSAAEKQTVSKLCQHLRATDGKNVEVVTDL